MEKTATILLAWWPFIGIGLFTLVAGYLWAIRERIRDGIRKRRRKPEPPSLLDDPEMEEDELYKSREFGDLGYMSPKHHLADKALVDVEIRSLHRERSEGIRHGTSRLDVRQDGFVPMRPDRSETPLPSPVQQAPDVVDEDTLPPTAPKSLEKPPHLALAFTVVAPRGQNFLGLDIQAVAEELFCQLNAQGLYESYTIDADAPVVSIAHLRKPGIFDPSVLHDLKTPGLLLFTHLPGPVSGMEALDALVAAADQWAHKLGGMICDEKRYRMSNHDLLRLRDKIQIFEQQLRLFERAQQREGRNP